MINVAIIDDGISDQKFIIKTIKEHIIVDDDRIIRNAYPYIDEFSHGSICAALLTANKDEFCITSIGMLCDEHNGEISIKSAMNALKICLDLDIEILLLSWGIVDYTCYYDMLDIINDIYDKGIVIIAAAEPSEKMTIPACYSNVLGVMYSPYCKNSRGYRFIDNSISGTDVLVDVNENVIMRDGTTNNYSKASSYAVPVLCSKMLGQISEMRELCEIKKKNGILKEKGFDWMVDPLIIICSEEKRIILDDMVIFGSYTVLNLYPPSEQVNLTSIIEHCRKAKDVIIVDCISDGDSMFGIEKEFLEIISSTNIALLSDNIYFSKYLNDVSKHRLYLSSGIESKTVVQNAVNKDIKVIEVKYRDEQELRRILTKDEDLLYVSFDKLHMLYGVDYVPKKFQTNQELLNKYLSNLSYIYNKNEIYIIKEECL